MKCWRCGSELTTGDAPDSHMCRSCEAKPEQAESLEAPIPTPPRPIDGDLLEVAKRARECAAAWGPGVRLIGDCRACDLLAILTEYVAMKGGREDEGMEEAGEYSYALRCDYDAEQGEECEVCHRTMRKGEALFWLSDGSCSVESGANACEVCQRKVAERTTGEEE